MIDIAAGDLGDGGTVDDDFAFGDFFQVMGSAHDIVGDQVRQMRGDGEDAIVMGGVEAFDQAAQRFPESFEGLQLTSGRPRTVSPLLP